MCKCIKKNPKILLIGVNAKYIHSNPAVYYLKSFCVKRAEETGEDKKTFESGIEIAEYTINQDRKEVLKDIYEKRPDVLAFSCYLWNISFVKALMSDIHKVMPDAGIWLGGPEVSFDAEKLLKEYPYVTGVMTGEGEENFYKIAKHYLVGDGNIELPKILAENEELDFDKVPFPYDDLKKFENRIIYYETSRGCPFGCAYCLSSVDRRVRIRSMELVRKELQMFLDAKVPQVKFVDRTFNCQKDHTRAILEYIRDNDNGVTNFHFEVAAELITEEETELLASLRPGLVQLEIGVQTTNAETLCCINRKSDIGKLRRIVEKLVAARNMHIHLDLIAGLPEEDLTSFRKSFDEVYSMKPDDLQLGFLKILKGSPMETRVEQYGIVYSDEPPYEVLSTRWLSFEDILELKEVENVLEIYHNSGQFINTMHFLEKKYESPYMLYYDISRYYKVQGLDKIGQNRYARYSTIREFFKAKFGENELEAMTECILKDLYLRENIKSRPEYGAAGLVDKESYRKFFESGTYKKYISEADYAGFTPVQISHMVHIEKTKAGFEIYDYKVKDRLYGNARCVKIEGGDF